MPLLSGANRHARNDPARTTPSIVNSETRPISDQPIEDGNFVSIFGHARRRRGHFAGTNVGAMAS
jgi:hypothetical protein